MPARQPCATITPQARFHAHRRAEGRGRKRKSAGKAGKLRYLIQKHAARAAALRLPAGMERHADELGGAEGPERESRRQAARGACRGSSARLRQFRRHDPEGRIWRRHRDAVGPRHLGSRTSDVDEALKKGKLAFTLHGERLHGQLGAGAAAQALAEGQGQLAADQGARRIRSARAASSRPRRETSSVKSGRSMDEIAARQDGLAFSNRGERRKPKPDSEDCRQRPRRRRKAKPRGSKKKLAAKSSAQSSRRSSSRSSQRWSTRRPPAMTGCTRSSIDGYRAITSLAGGKVVIRTRNGLDWTDKFQSLVPALQDLPCESALLDGEIAVADARGPHRFRRAAGRAVATAGAAWPITCSTCWNSTARICASVR